MLQSVDKIIYEEKDEKLKQMMQDLKSILSKKRYLHSIGAMEKAIELAKIYKVNEKKAAYTALVHDMAKEMTKEEYYEYANKNNIELSKDDIMCPAVIHGIIASDIAKKKYGFDKEMCDAIYYHTTGRPNMTLFEKIIFLADKVEERTRPKDKADVIRNIIKEKGLDEAFLWIADDYTIPKAIKQRTTIHPNTINTRNDIIQKLK